MTDRTESVDRADFSTAAEVEAYNQQGIDQLVRIITLSQGEFAPVLVVCNYAHLRQQMVDRLRKQSPVDIQGISLPKKSPRLLPAIESRMQRHPPALMLFGLEKVEHLEQVLHRANRIREEFRNHFPLPLIIWVNDRTLAMVTRHAPDFYGWMPIAIRFELSTPDLVNHLQQRVTGEFSKFLSPTALIESLPFDPEQYHQPYAELAAALKDLDKRHHPLPADLLAGVQFVQGREALARNQLGTARDCFDRSLAFFSGFSGTTDTSTSTNNLTSHAAPYQACVHFHLGLVWRLWATVDRGNYEAHCHRARHHFRACLEIFQHLGRVDLVAQYLTPLAEVLQRLRAWDELAELAMRGLDLHRQFKDAIRLANDYGLLAIVATARQQWIEAQRFAMAALDTLHMAEEEGVSDLDLAWANTYHRNWYRFTLAQAWYELGEVNTAIAILEQARQHKTTHYDPSLAITLHEYLRQIYYQQGQYDRAFALKQIQRAIEHQYGFRAFLGAGQLHPQRHVANPVQPDEGNRQARIAREISTSGRKQDVDTLVFRLRDSQHRLIVIHGPSGVGKSSILSAALVPALQQTRLEYREILPILLRRYDRWEQDLIDQLLASPAQEALQAQPSTLHPLPWIQFLASEDYFPILIFDQFEEFFFHPDQSQPEQRLPFYRFLRDCLNTYFVKVVLSIREDYIHYLLEFDRLTALEIINDDILSKDIRYYLGDFTPDQATDVIRSAIQGTPYQPDPDLITQLVTDLAGQLQMVRPIELQIVGAELQDSNITTLADYQKLGSQPKEALVMRSLQRVIADCGKEQNQQDLAQLVLYLLTDDKEHRLQKTANELLQDLQTFGITLPPLTPDSSPSKGDLGESSLAIPEQIPPNPPFERGSPDSSPPTTPHTPHPLSLILTVLQGSGILLHNLADPEPRYQIVHDYLVSYIRQHYRNRLEANYAALEAKYQQTLADKLAVEEQLNQTLAAKLRQTRRTVAALSVSAALVAVAAIAATTFGIRAEQQRQLAQLNEVKTLDASAETLYASDRPFDALLVSLKSARQLQQLPKVAEENRHLIQGTLQETLYNTHERLRFGSDKAPVNGIVYSPDGKQVATSGSDGTVRLWDLQGRQLAELKGHQGWVTSVVYSPDGKQVATSGSDGTVRLWDLQGKQLAELKGHQGRVTSVVYSPDGKQVATSGSDGTIRLWDLQGKQLAEFKGHQGRVTSIVYSPDGKQVATSGSDGTARLWDLQGKQLAELKGHEGSVYSVVYSPVRAASSGENGRQVATSGSDGTARLWDLQGKQLAELRGHQGDVWSVVYSPDGKQVATSGSDGTVRLWDLQGKQLAELRGHQGWVTSVVYSPDGKQVATSGSDGTVRLWDLQGKQLAELRGHQGQVTSVVYSPDGKQVATSGSDGTARLWDLQGKQLTELKGHRGDVTSITYSPDGKQVATSGSDGTARLWDLQGKQLAELKGHQGRVTSVVYSPDGKQVATSGSDGTVRLWDLQGKQLAELKGHEGSVYSVVYSPDGKQVATSSGDRTARLWNLQGKQLAELKGHQGWVTSVVYSPDGKQVATSGSDSIARLWDLQGKQLAELRGHQGWVTSVVYSPDGKQVATSDGTIRLWDLQGKQLAELRGHQGRVTSVVYSPDGKQVATSGSDGTIRLWDLQGKQLAELKGHEGSVYSVVYSPVRAASSGENGKQVATVGSDGTARLWDLQGKQLAELKGHQGWVNSVVYSPDGKQVATVGSDGTARLWDLQGQQLAIFESEAAEFSPDGTVLATITGDTVKLWPVETFEQLLGRACAWVRLYLTNNPEVSTEDKRLCDGI